MYEASTWWKRYAATAALALLACLLMANDGSCLPEDACERDADCDEGFVCVDGVCEEEPEPCICPAVYAPVCGIDGETYGNSCEAACADVEIEYEGECRGECPPLCDLYCPYGNVIDENGCELCECNDPPLCMSDDDCIEGHYCNHDECLSSCDPAEPDVACPAVCYGVCEERTDCICPDVWAPVCGIDGRTYGNSCEARCAGVPIDYEGECDEVCACPEIYAPVCGADGNTYSNRCFARCAEVEVVHEGECDACACPDVWAPVCGVDGNTYGNRCEARCAGVEVRHEGECRPRECRSNADCPADLICYPPEGVCTPMCVVDCFRYDPVCGIDGETYGCGEADAWCHGVEVAYEGECRDACDCPAVWDPVCGEDGLTYANRCFARCAEVDVLRDGSCEELCSCDDVYAPVCGVDGSTYANACEARCAGIPIDYEGECRDDCACPDVWDPVCGTDGVTYGNACEARCAGVRVLYPGVCEDRECRSNDDCPDDLVCYPPEGVCQPECAIDCLRPDPVCGVDGETYWCGEADAWCHGVEVAHEGECRDVCMCPLIYAPVCGVDGVTYGNRCQADCAGVEVDYAGECRVAAECRSNEDCPRGEVCYPPTDTCEPMCEIACVRYEPVCGEDGVTYGCGQADAWCHGVDVAYRGECDELCACPRIWAPVCGEDGKTYANACEARCDGVPVAYEGECRVDCREPACELYCEFGWALGADGCPVCACAEPVRCEANSDCVEGFVCEPERICSDAVCDDADDPACAVERCYGACVRR